MKATFQLADGTTVLIEGSEKEIRKLLDFYDKPATLETNPLDIKRKYSQKVISPKTKTDAPTKSDLAEIVKWVRTCDEASKIQSQVLDSASEVNRVLLPLYIVHEYMKNSFGLTTVEIGIITTDLGIKVFRQNALRALTKTGARYVVGDRVRKDRPCNPILA